MKCEHHNGLINTADVFLLRKSKDLLALGELCSDSQDSGEEQFIALF